MALNTFSIPTQKNALKCSSHLAFGPALPCPQQYKLFNKVSIDELKQLADEMRSDVIFKVSKTGGHLGSSLGVVELTVALHYVFDATEDKILWDIGHQTYQHKILTGRIDQMHTMRQTNGLAGFTKRSESEYDCFGTGHSSTTISAGLGNYF